MSHIEKQYDAIIIGAGIGGLVCGCFLAKAGMKVLLADRHNKPGGYCSSFKRNGFTFDAAAHSFGGVVKGNLGRIFDELDLKKKVKIKRFNPSDTITTPDYSITFWPEVDKTIEEFRAAFPTESDSIKKFFNFLTDPGPLFLARIRSCTFLDLLNQYFTNHKLKAILSFPLYGNAGGLPPSRMSAFIAVKIFKEFLLDGGYYSEGGMQNLSNALADIFMDFGGELLLSHHVKQIKVEEGCVTGVILNHVGFIAGQRVISNCDARQTFLELIDKERIPREFLEKVGAMTQTLSTFIAHVGVDNESNILQSKRNLWFLSDYDLDFGYCATKNGDFTDIGRYLVHAAPEQKTISAYLNVPFKDKQYWTDNKESLLEALVQKISSDIPFAGLAKHIVYKGGSTPQDLYRYTLNFRGATCGWENTPSQLALPDFRRHPLIKGLYLTGHWATHGLGIPGVSYLGYDTAKLILRRINR